MVHTHFHLSDPWYGQLVKHDPVVHDPVVCTKIGLSDKWYGQLVECDFVVYLCVELSYYQDRVPRTSSFFWTDPQRILAHAIPSPCKHKIRKC